VQPRPRRTLVVVLFGGEEEGLLGSKHYVAHLPVSLGKPVGLYNLDMVGAGTGAYMAGGENFPELAGPFEAAVARVLPGMPLRKGRSEGEPRADHGPFMQAGIPAVSLFSMGGEHHGYHTNADTVYWITPKIMETIGRELLDAVVAVANK
jgi:Zn-dependent M28 family amino/carboxypeptidase